MGLCFGINGLLGLYCLLFVLIMTIITDYVSVGSISLYIIIPVLAYTSGAYSNIVVRCAVVLFIVGMIKHWINAQRIMNGTETGLRSVFKKNKAE